MYGLFTKYSWTFNELDNDLFHLAQFYKTQGKFTQATKQYS